MISSELWDLCRYQSPFRQHLAQNSSGALSAPLYLVTARHSDHLNFCDIHFMGSSILMKKKNFLGPVDHSLLSDALTQLILRFFVSTATHRNQRESNNDKSGSNISDSKDLFAFCGIVDSSVSQLCGGEKANRSQEEGANDEENTQHSQALLSTTSTSSPAPSSINNAPSRHQHQGQPVWSSIEPLPARVRHFILTHIVDESTLPHCFDDEYFRKLTS
jgi:hypothetical protein